MFGKKKLVINTEILDTRKMRLEDYERYELILINTELMIVSEESKNLLTSLPATVNCEETLELPASENIKVDTVNGTHSIGPSSALPERDTVLIVNGTAHFEPGTQAIAERYALVMVNGTLSGPKSVLSSLKRLKVNGSTEAYPDGYMPLKRRFVLDKHFALRARSEGKYYASKYILVQKDVSAQALADKNLRFETKTLIAPESMIETLAPLFNEEAEFVVVPDEYALLAGPVELNKALIEKYGPRLFIYGDMSVARDSEGTTLFPLLQKLIVRGTVTIDSASKEALSALDAEYEQLRIARSRVLENAVHIKVDKALLDKSPDGVTVQNAANVTLADDITPDEILEKLEIRNCASVICTQEQKGAVAAIGQNIAHIGPADEKDSPLGFGNLLDMFRNLTDTKMVNAESYML